MFYYNVFFENEEMKIEMMSDEQYASFTSRDNFFFFYLRCFSVPLLVFEVNHCNYVFVSLSKLDLSNSSLKDDIIDEINWLSNEVKPHYRRIFRYSNDCEGNYLSYVIHGKIDENIFNVYINKTLKWVVKVTTEITNFAGKEDHLSEKVVRIIEISGPVYEIFSISVSDFNKCFNVNIEDENKEKVLNSILDYIQNGCGFINLSNFSYKQFCLFIEKNEKLNDFIRYYT